MPGVNPRSEATMYAGDEQYGDEITSGPAGDVERVYVALLRPNNDEDETAVGDYTILLKAYGYREAQGQARATAEEEDAHVIGVYENDGSF